VDGAERPPVAPQGLSIMIQRHLVPRVLGIAATVAAVTFTAANVAGADPGTIETIQVNAAAGAAAVRLTPPVPSTSRTVPRSTVPGAKVPATLTPLQCGVALDNFGDGRSGGRSHEGDDIAAPRNTEVYAVVDGTLTDQVKVGEANSSLSGNAWYLTSATGASYFYAHLDHFAALPVGATVKQGEVIGYVGDTGNPAPGSYHLHFGIAPNGRNNGYVNPQSYLAVTPCPK
jgi:peptidoglycan LD-endopeptidase LytH